MTLDQILALGVLVGTLVLFIWGRFRYDVVAALALVVVSLLGLIELNQALAGFSNPAVITVAAVLIISHALKNSGVVELIGQRMQSLTASPVMHIASMSLVVGFASAFMNNAGAMAVMLPVALASCAQRNRSPALLLMPLAFASLLGGMLTMIGTPPNILIAQYRREAVGESFAMFDFIWVGLPLALVGIAFLALVGWKLIPVRRRQVSDNQESFQVGAYYTEMRVRKNSALVGKKYVEAAAALEENAVITGLVQEDGAISRVDQTRPVEAGDIIIVKADAAHLRPAMDEGGLELAIEARLQSRGREPENPELVEAHVSLGSRLEGRSVEALQRWSGNQLRVLAVARQGRPIRRRLSKVRIHPGDILLIRGEETVIPDVLEQLKLLPLPRRELKIELPPKVVTSLLVFAGAIVVGMTGILPLAIAFLAAIIVYILLDILPIRDLYSTVEWPIIILLACLIPVGLALEETGATMLVASGLVQLTDALPLWSLLLLIMIVTMTLSDVINNAATVVVMAPIALGIAAVTETSPDPYLMAVAISASCAFLTPIGHQSNTLVMGAGGYRFGDYWRMGLPLELLVLILGLPLILLFWPL